MKRGSGMAGAVACAVLAAGIGAARAQTAPGPRAIYRCDTAKQKNAIADRPMTDCTGPQYFLNPDGSVNRLVPPPLTDEERAAAEAKEREDDAARRARQVEARADLALLKRYPDKATHDLARKAALDQARADIRASDARIAELMHSRKPLLDEAEFYVNKPLPTKVKSGLDANDAALAAQKALKQNQEEEVDRVNKVYDAELARLMKLWAAKPTPVSR